MLFNLMKIWSLLVCFLLIITSKNATVDSCINKHKLADLMVGNGLFTNSSLLAFNLDHSHTTTLVPWGGENILK